MPSSDITDTCFADKPWLDDIVAWADKWQIAAQKIRRNKAKL